MFKVTEEMRKSAYAMIDGRCPVCDKLLEVRGSGLVDEERELFWFCPTCGFSNETDTACFDAT